ncbi:MAG: MFS transporter, partial [Kangiellaceae bacterium]|nr:MFS transporter [Kangiellaceae bacterium]
MRFLPLFAAIFAITPLAIDLYLPAMPVIADHFSSEIEVIQNSLSVYLIGYACGMFLFGPVADRFGRRPLVLLGLGMFAIISWVLPLVSNPELFVALRFFQALFGGAATVVIPGAIKELFGKDTAKGLSYVSMIMMIAPMLAPAIGSQLMLIGEWAWIFKSLSIYALIMLVIAYFKFPDLGHLDHRTEQNPASEIRFLASYRIVFGTPKVKAFLAISMLSSVVFFGYITSVSFLYMQVYSLNESQFSLLFGVNVIGLIAASFINTRLVPRLGSRLILIGGVVGAFVLGLSFLGLLVFNANFALIAANFMLITSFMMVISANSDAMILRQFSAQVGTA